MSEINVKDSEGRWPGEKDYNGEYHCSPFNWGKEYYGNTNPPKHFIFSHTTDGGINQLTGQKETNFYYKIIKD